MDGPIHRRSSIVFCPIVNDNERSPALAALRRYYPGFLAALFLVLLRTAIGWHFLTEGLEKVNPPDGKPFTAENYLRNATGPLDWWFRAQVPDVDSLQALSRDHNGQPTMLKETWQDELEKVSEHFHFTPEQREKAEKALQDIEEQADAWFSDLGNAQRIEQYEAGVERLRERRRNPNLLQHEWVKYYVARGDLEQVRIDLTAPLRGWSESLHTQWADLITQDQRSQYGEPPRPPMTALDWINLTTAWGLTLAGIGLMLGLLTPLSALVGAALLCMFYLSMPPWPGLPVPPNAEGHYWIVNKNLVEMLACLALVTIPTGRWIGLDALLFGWLGRRRGTAPAPQATGNEPPGSNPAPAINGPERERPRGSTEPQSVPVSRS